MAKGKSFKGQIENPAMAFISAQPQEGAVSAPAAEEAAPVKKATGIAKPPTGYKVNYQYVETRSKRAQFLFQPTVFAKLQERAAEEGISVNELVNNIVIEALGILG